MSEGPCFEDRGVLVLWCRAQHVPLPDTSSLTATDTIVAKDYCSFQLTEEKMKAFKYAIKNHYWYQMYLGEGVLFCTLIHCPISYMNS